MNAKGESILLRALAVVLLVGIAFNGVRLFALVSDERALDALASSDADADARLRDLTAIDADRLTDVQQRRLVELKREVTTDALLQSLTITTSNGADVPLGDDRPTGVSGSATRLRLTLDRSSAVKSVIRSVRIGERAADFSESGVAELEVAVAGLVEIHPRFDGEVTTADHRLGILLRSDDRPPRITFTSDGTAPSRRDGDRIDLRAGEALLARVDDESRLAELSWAMTRDGTRIPRVVADLATARPSAAWPIDYGDEILHETTLTLEVTATDTAGNTATETVRVARWKRPPPTVTGAWIDGRPANGELITAVDAVVAAIAVDDLHPDSTLEVQSRAVRTALTRGDDGRYAAPIPLEGATNDLRFLAVSDGWRTEIAAALVTRDVSPPRIAVLDPSGAPLVVDDLEVAGAVDLEVWVTDDVALDPNEVEVRREGRIGLSSPTIDVREYRRPVRIEEDATLTITAVDLAGNETARSVRFTIRPTLPPDDAAGPRISVRYGDIELSPTSEAVLLGESAALTVEVVDDAGLGEVEITGGTVTPPGDDGDVWAVSAAGPVSISATDGHGNRTERRYPITLVRVRPRLTRIDDVRTAEGEAIVQLSGAPRTFRFVTPDRPPEGLISARLMGPDGETGLQLETGSNGGTFPDDARLGDGTWILALSLQTLDGLEEVDRVTFAVTRPAGPVLAATIAGKVVPDGSPVSVASLDELLITAPSDARIQAVFDGAAVPLKQDGSGWRAHNPQRSTAGGTLLVRGTANGGATTEITFRVTASPYRLTTDLATRLSQAQALLASGDVDGAEALVAGVESQVARDLASRLDRSRGVELSKLNEVRDEVARFRANAGNRADGSTPTIDVSKLAPSITNDRDGATLVLVNADEGAFYLYETEVTLEMFLGFLDATLGDNDFWNRRGLNGRALGVFREEMRAVFVKSDDKKSLPARFMRGEWAEAYVEWASVGMKPAGTLRLPTVEEWVLAAGGGNATSFPTTAGFADGSDIDQHQNRAGANWSTRGPKPVGWYEPGAFGLRDMAGNVVEICRGRNGDGDYHLAGGSYLCRRKEDLSIAAVKPYVGSKTEPSTIGFRLLFEIR